MDSITMLLQFFIFLERLGMEAIQRKDCIGNKETHPSDSALEEKSGTRFFQIPDQDGETFLGGRHKLFFVGRFLAVLAASGQEHDVVADLVAEFLVEVAQCVDLSCPPIITSSNT